MRLLDSGIVLALGAAIALVVAGALYWYRRAFLPAQVIASLGLAGLVYLVTADGRAAFAMGVGQSLLIYGAGWMQREHGPR